MRELRNVRAQRFEDFDLRCRVGDVIFAADDVRHAEFDVVDHRRQRVEEASVLALEHRIGNRMCVDLHPAADEIVPSHLFQRQFEAPMRRAASSFQFGASSSERFNAVRS